MGLVEASERVSLVFHACYRSRQRVACGRQVSERKLEVHQVKIFLLALLALDGGGGPSSDLRAGGGVGGLAGKEAGNVTRGL